MKGQKAWVLEAATVPLRAVSTSGTNTYTSQAVLVLPRLSREVNEVSVQLHAPLTVSTKVGCSVAQWKSACLACLKLWV